MSVLERARLWWRHGRHGRHAAGPDHVFHEAFCGGLSGDVHTEFGLSYASYLVWPRSLMQEMPARWQHDFALLAGEMQDTFRAPLDGATYAVFLRDERGRFIHDPLNRYRHGLDKHALARARDVYGRQDAFRLG